MQFFNLKQPHVANEYPQYEAVYSKWTAVYSRVYGRILRYWSLQYTAVYPKSPKWGIFNTTLIITIGKLEVFPNPSMHALCIIHSYPPVHATYPFLPKPPFLPVYSQVFLVCQVMLTILSPTCGRLPAALPRCLCYQSPGRLVRAPADPVRTSAGTSSASAARLGNPAAHTSGTLYSVVTTDISISLAVIATAALRPLL